MKRIKLPLFWKFTLAIILIVALFGSINTILIYKNVYYSLTKEAEKRSLFISGTLVSQIVNSYLFEDLVEMQNIINNAMSIDNSIKYIFILNQSNEVIVHTFEKKVSDPLIFANNLQDNDSTKIKLLNIGNESSLIIDIASPIINNSLGTIRIGISQETLQKDVQQTINVFVIMIGLFLIAGILGALAFANFITSPIKLIQSTADKIDLSEIGNERLSKIRIREKFLNKFIFIFRAEDEIDTLTAKFNDMLDRLSNAYLELQKTQDNLLQSEKLATIGTLTAGFAHEINNPVAGLQNCIRRIKNNPSNIEQNIKYINMMENAANKIENVVKGLLNFSRKQEFDSEPLSLAEIVENSLLLVSHSLEKNRISITKNIEENLPAIRGNKNQLEQVILNLLLNAIDAIEEKQNTIKQAERRILITSNLIDNKIELNIEDSGIGIAKNNLNKIYDPFFTTKSIGKGTGLGLSVAYNIIKAHNGKISLESEEGKGTIVTLSLKINK